MSHQNPCKQCANPLPEPTHDGWVICAVCQKEQYYKRREPKKDVAVTINQLRQDVRYWTTIQLQAQSDWDAARRSSLLRSGRNLWTKRDVEPDQRMGFNIIGCFGLIGGLLSLAVLCQWSAIPVLTQQYFVGTILSLLFSGGLFWYWLRMQRRQEDYRSLKQFHQVRLEELSSELQDAEKRLAQYRREVY